MSFELVTQHDHATTPVPGGKLTTVDTAARCELGASKQPSDFWDAEHGLCGHSIFLPRLCDHKIAKRRRLWEEVERLRAA